MEYRVYCMNELQLYFFINSNKLHDPSIFGTFSYLLVMDFESKVMDLVLEFGFYFKLFVTQVQKLILVFRLCESYLLVLYCALYLSGCD